MLAAGREGMCVCRERVYERVCVGVKVAGRCAYMSRFIYFFDWFSTYQYICT